MKEDNNDNNTNNSRQTVAERMAMAFFRTLSRLPLGMLYALSSVGFVLLYYIVRYRRHVVRANISSAFPEKDEQWQRRTERGFYRWFCDYLMEAVKLLTISGAELRRRFTIEGAEQVEQCFAEGQDVGAILGHYCNWEWLSCIGIALPEGRKCGLVYHPLRSAVFDRLFREIRSSQPSGLVVPKKDILRSLVTLRRDGVRSIFGYIADQGPRWTNIHLWLPFMHHDTPVFTGAERIMRKMDNAVFYVDMTRPRRGYYTCRFQLITRTPNDLPEFEITRRFFALLEQSIRRDPRYYLWSHNRWKRTHEEFNRRYVVVDGKVIPRSHDNHAETDKQ